MRVYWWLRDRGRVCSSLAELGLLIVGVTWGFARMPVHARRFGWSVAWLWWKCWYVPGYADQDSAWPRSK
jgi:hypothetical protein